jgi:LPXTG-site transpeptidase (sortase) family protein
LNDDDGTPGLSAGDTISYAFTVTNTGDVTLTGITLADTVGGVTISGGPIASLAAGASDGSTFTGSYTVTQSDIDSGSFTNTATVTGTPPSGPDVNDPDSETVTLAGTPTMTVDKSSVTASLSASGTVTYDYLVTNTGNVTLTGITLADDNDNDDLSCAAATLAPGGTTACTATHTFTQAELDAGGTLDNTVTTSSNEAPDATDNLSIPITQAPGLSLGKVYDGYADNDGSTTLTVGDDLNFTLTMRNTGNTTLTTVVVSDGQLTPNSQTCASVAPSGTCVLAGSYTVTQADVDAGSFTNTGTVTDDDVCPGAGAATCEDSVSTPIPQAPTMTVDKSSVTASLSAPGTVTYDYLVTNTGNVTLTGITLADDNDNDDLSCAAATLAPGGTTACTATHTFTQVELDAGGTLDNTVTTSSNEAPDATDNLSIPITQAPGLNVVKEVSDDDATWVNNVTVAVGDTVYYRVRVENTGNVTLTGLSMTDPACTLVRGVDLTGDDDTDFEVGEEWAYTCQVTAFAGTQPNTATADSNETGPDTDGASYLGIGAPSINKNFAPDPIPALGVSTLTFTLTNPNSSTALNSVGFSDTFPSSPGAMVVAASPNPTNTCGGTFTAVAGAGSVTLAGASISASSNCTVSVDVTAPSAGTYDNTSSSVSSSNGGTGNAASDTLTLTVGAALVIDPALTKSGDPATARVGEVVTFTLQVFNNGTGDATGVVVTDLLPSFLDYNGIVAPGASSTSYDGPTNTVTINYATVQPGDLFTITITTTVNSLGLPPGGTNTASLLSATADADLNNNSSSALLTIVTGSGLRAPETGFAPDRATQLPQMPDQRIYETYGELTLRIPKLGLSTTIVGVPMEAEGWDVAWLSGQVGYLDGTAFPGWQGNSVLTGHVYLPSGLPGPFVDLGQLRWGDRAIIDSFGTRSTYEVRESALLRPDDPSIIRHEEQSWLTLLTCSGYQESTDTYLWRRVVRLVLIDAAWQGSSPGRSGR